MLDWVDEKQRPTDPAAAGPNHQKRDSTAAPGPQRRAPAAREYLTAREVEQLLAAARTRGGRYGHRDATLILLAYHHSLRASIGPEGLGRAANASCNGGASCRRCVLGSMRPAEARTLLSSPEKRKIAIANRRRQMSAHGEGGS